MKDAVLFTDIMSHLVSRVKAELVGTEFETVRVAVIADDSPVQVIFRRDGGNRASTTVMNSIVSVNIHAPLNAYGTAERLSNLVAAIFEHLPDGNPIVNVDVQAFTSDISDATGQRRFMRFAVSHRGGNYITG